MKNANISKTIKTVRSLGVAALLLSGFIFLMQGYSDWDGFQRFLAFSGVNLLIGGFGVFCAQVWQEPKGARTMLALAGAGVAAQFAQLGGMVYTIWHKWMAHLKNIGQSDLSSYLRTEVPEIFSTADVQVWQVAVAAGILLVLGVPICRLAFRVLNRLEASTYFNLFFINAGFLLLPFRSPPFIILQMLLGGGLLFLMVRRGQIDLRKTYTFEKWLTLLIGMSPVVIGVARSLFYIDHLLTLASVTSLGLTAGLFIFNEFRYRAPQLESSVPTANHKKKHSSTLFFASLTWIFFSCDILEDLILSEVWMGFLVVAPMVLAFGESVKRNWMEKTTGQLLTIFALCGFGYGQLMQIGLVNGLLLCGMAMIATYYGFINRDKSVFVVGCLTMILGLIETAIQGLSFDMIFSWINLAIIGIVTILLASFMEKKFQRIKNFHSELSQRFSTQS